MVVAGNETTTKLLANCWYWSWRHPDQGRRPFADPRWITHWVEETLRFDTSSHVLARMTTAAVEMYGTTIPAGCRVVLLPASANRDECVFPDPDYYDLSLNTGELLSLGNGRHFCLGASPARLEARIVLEELVARVASYEVDAARVLRVHSSNVLGSPCCPPRYDSVKGRPRTRDQVTADTDLATCKLTITRAGSAISAGDFRCSGKGCSRSWQPREPVQSAVWEASGYSVRTLLGKRVLPDVALIVWQARAQRKHHEDGTNASSRAADSDHDRRSGGGRP
jgi:hypothetical protein